MNSAPIGIFDSGLGGLTILRSLEKKFPNESFIYLGDTARVPYGNKSAQTIINYSKQIGEFLTNYNVKLIIVACNTSSALALNVMQNYFSIPVFGVIEPAVLYVENKFPKSNSIAVIGTRGTIESKAYSKQFKKIGSTKNIIEKACPLFVPIIEEGLSSELIINEIINYYLNDLRKLNINQFILGCTHYPILKFALKNFLGENAELITSELALSNILEKFMIEQNLFSNKKQSETSFYITDMPQKFLELGSRFFGSNLCNVKYISNF